MKPSYLLILSLLAQSGCDPDLEREHFEAMMKQEKGAEKSAQQTTDLTKELKQLGVEDIGKIKGLFTQRGIADKQMKGALLGLVKVMHAMKKEGDSYEMHPDLRAHLEHDLELKLDHITLIERFARRLLARKVVTTEQPRPDIADHYKKVGVDDLESVKQALSDAGIPEDKMSGALGGLIRTIHGAREEPGSEMDPKMNAYFATKLQLTDAQIAYIDTLSRHIAAGDPVGEDIAD